MKKITEWCFQSEPIFINMYIYMCVCVSLCVIKNNVWVQCYLCKAQKQVRLRSLAPGMVPEKGSRRSWSWEYRFMYFVTIKLYTHIRCYPLFKIKYVHAEFVWTIWKNFRTDNHVSRYQQLGNLICSSSVYLHFPIFYNVNITYISKKCIQKDITFQKFFTMLTLHVKNVKKKKTF